MTSAIDSIPSGLLPGKELTAPFTPVETEFKSKTLLHSFAFAWDGLAYAARTQRNFRIHLCVAVATLSVGMLVHISLMEWALLWGIIGLVLFAELTNTAVELLVDMVTEGRFDLRAKAIKDMCAGAVFVTALAAVAIGVSIFVPHLSQFF